MDRGSTGEMIYLTPTITVLCGHVVVVVVVYLHRLCRRTSLYQICRVQQKVIVPTTSIIIYTTMLLHSTARLQAQRTAKYYFGRRSYKTVYMFSSPSPAEAAAANP
ncbi:hypothetical protein DPMN_190835 [Dreissena polymorpha]|uniref:Uncharacterized protein n=1 Tax=Dreissena polymorpha TaxID=45954 RepID=A0A9D3XV31_DREPO|nr:hypothetical protein DPMN_190835 [Dreissena polymorpha]